MVDTPPRTYCVRMNILFWIIAIIAIVLLVVGGVVEAVRFLLWVGIALLLLAVIAWALRKIGGSKR
jgi:cytochrome b subunit of formate dehydrogenase